MIGVFLLLMLSCGAVWVAVVLIMPAASRARFVEQVSAIRDDCDDAVLGGELPDAESVRHFIAKADLMARNARSMLPAFAVAVLITLKDHGIKLEDEQRKVPFSDLSPEQRELMEGLDRRLVNAIALQFSGGSIFWWFLVPARIIGSRLLSKTSDSPLVSPARAAESYSRAIDQHGYLQHAVGT